jgi:excinuclease UvrABC ATPase subunit
LAVKYRGKNINDVLESTTAEALEHFRSCAMWGSTM